MNIVFAGPIRNCEKNLEKNLDFLISLKKNSIINEVSIFILESDSYDKTREKLKKYVNDSNFFIYFKDNLEESIPNRVERIAYCRNYLLKKINEEKISFDFYIPVDLDLDLFSSTSISKFISVIEELSNDSNNQAYFPYSTPFYYDVAALRSNNWVENDIWIKYYRMTKYIPIGKVFFRIFILYRKQKSMPKNLRPINVKSAFGGMGIYKLNNQNLNNLKYGILDEAQTADHIMFNNKIKNMAVLPNWNFNAPAEHIEYKLLSPLNKLKYIIKEIFLDFKILVFKQ
tara:strand:- start:1355 stop:2212 length:858 start_codon:yes stop_codon:yes gene_type:complete